MILAIDIGNTNINFGLFKAKKLAAKFIIPTKDYSLNKLKNRLGGTKIDETIICSVVPRVSGMLAKDVTALTGTKPYVLGRNIAVPIKNLYRTPKLVGQDRLVNAYAGVELYGAPLIVIDFGTAVTFDIVSKNRSYLGGMILPGLHISLDALAHKTALLPNIKLEKPREFIGRDTRNSMLSGLVYGFAALTDDLVKRIKHKIGTNARVVGTGGDIHLLAHYCRTIDFIDKDITLKGLNLIAAL